MKNNNKEIRTISKIFTRLFFTYKDIVVLENKKDCSVTFYFTVSNFYSNHKSRDFSLIYKKNTGRFILYSKGSIKLYASNYLNDILSYLKLSKNIGKAIPYKYRKEIDEDD